MGHTVYVRWQFCRDGYDVTSQPLYAEQDADEARAWDGDPCLVAVARDPDDPTRWRIGGHRFASPAGAVAYLAAHHGVAYQPMTDEDIDTA